MTPSLQVARLFLLLSCLPRAAGFPGAAGDCPFGQAAVQDVPEHLSNVTMQTLTEAGFSVVIDPPQIIAYEGTTIELLSTSNKTFRGFLLRLESLDGDRDFSLEPLNASSAHTAVACERYGDFVLGVSHAFNDDKKAISAEFMPWKVGTFALDVTVVESNNHKDGSIYSYGQIPLTVLLEATSVPTASPTTNASIAEKIEDSRAEFNTTTTPSASSPTTEPTSSPVTPMPTPRKAAVPTLNTFPPSSLNSISGVCRIRSLWLIGLVGPLLIAML